MQTIIPELLKEAADEIMCAKPHWRDDGCGHMLDAGVAIAKALTITSIDGIREGRYLVGSHIVNMVTFSCGCLEFTCQGTCRHVMAVLVYDWAQRMLDEFEREYETWDIEPLPEALPGIRSVPISADHSSQVVTKATENSGAGR